MCSALASPGSNSSLCVGGTSSPMLGRADGQEPALSFCPSPPLPHPRGSSPSCLSATSSELCWPQAFVPWVSQRCPQHSPDQRGAVPACYTWCPSKSFGLYIFLLDCVYISRSFVVLVCFVFFFLSDTCKVFFIYVKIKYGFKAEWWSLFPQPEGWEGHSRIPQSFPQDTFMPLWLLIRH